MIPLGSGTIKLNFEKKQSIRLLKSPTELHLKKVVNDPNVDGYVEVVALEAPEPLPIPPYMLTPEFWYIVTFEESHQANPADFVDSFFVNGYQTPGFGVLVNEFDAHISLTCRRLDITCNLDEIPDALYVEPSA